MGKGEAWIADKLRVVVQHCCRHHCLHWWRHREPETRDRHTETDHVSEEGGGGRQSGRGWTADKLRVAGQHCSRHHCLHREGETDRDRHTETDHVSEGRGGRQSGRGRIADKLRVAGQHGSRHHCLHWALHDVHN